MGGYLDYFGLKDWYLSQPKEIQDFLYRSCGYGFTSSGPADSKKLLHGKILSYGSDKEPVTPTKFLCWHARNAVTVDRDHNACRVLMTKAKEVTRSQEDLDFYIEMEKLIDSEIEIYPDQKDIDSVKPEILNMIRNNQGILQSELKKQYPVEKEKIYGYAHAQIIKENKVRREKSGRSFKLYID